MPAPLPPINDAFVLWLDARLTDRGWTRQVLAIRANIATSTLSAIFRGVNRPSRKMVEKLANALATTTENRETLVAEAFQAAFTVPKENAARRARADNLLTHFDGATPKARERVAQLLRLGESLTNSDVANATDNDQELIHSGQNDGTDIELTPAGEEVLRSLENDPDFSTCTPRERRVFARWVSSRIPVGDVPEEGR